jgi:hypothetical protein
MYKSNAVVKMYIKNVFKIYESPEDGHRSGPKHVMEVIHIKLEILLRMEVWKKCLIDITLLAGDRLQSDESVWWQWAVWTDTQGWGCGLLPICCVFPCLRITISYKYKLSVVAKIRNASVHKTTGKHLTFHFVGRVLTTVPVKIHWDTIPCSQPVFPPIIRVEVI